MTIFVPTLLVSYVATFGVAMSGPSQLSDAVSEPVLSGALLRMHTTLGQLPVIAGVTVSVTTMFCVCVELLPWPSLNVQVTTEVPWLLRVSESVVVPVRVPEQLSVAFGADAIVAEHWPVTVGNVPTL